MWSCVVFMRCVPVPCFLRLYPACSLPLCLLSLKTNAHLILTPCPATNIVSPLIIVHAATGTQQLRGRELDSSWGLHISGCQKLWKREGSLPVFYYSKNGESSRTPSPLFFSLTVTFQKTYNSTYIYISLLIPLLFFDFLARPLRCHHLLLPLSS